MKIRHEASAIGPRGKVVNRLLSALVLSTLFAGSQAFAQTCTNLCLQQVVCPGNGTTSVSGIVRAPNGIDPLPNILVYVPNVPVPAFVPGVSCQLQGQPAPGSPLVSTFTAVDGSFTLTNMPAGANIPLVIQTGRWRRQVTIPAVASCTNTALSATLTRLPRNKTEGDIPKIAIVTGQIDALECVLRKIGIADSEFTNPTGTGRVNFYLGAGAPGAQISASTPVESSLWGTQATLNSYDMIMFPCQGNEFLRTAGQQNRMISYANSGGLIFATHFSYIWLFNDPPFSGTAIWDVQQPSPPDQTGFINTTFNKGLQLAQWLQALGASTILGQIPLQVLKVDQDAVVAPTTSWLTINNPSSETMQFTFNTPVGTAAQNQCGRVLFNEYHVENVASAAGVTFPAECAGGALTPQEHLLEFSIFDLSTFISPDTSPTLSVTLTNTPTIFTQGDAADTINIDALNTSLTNPTSPSLVLTATLPAGLAAVQMFGTNVNTGWNCDPATLTCARTGGLSANTSDPITVTVNVSPTAPLGVQPVSAQITNPPPFVVANGSVNITIQAPPTPTPASVNISGTITYCSNPSANPVPNVVLSLTGTSSGTTTTDGSGNYTFASLASGGSYTVTPTKSALASGSTGISTSDVLGVQRHFLGLTLLTGCKLTAADLNGDTNVNTTDVIATQRFFLGFTAGIANAGKYLFSPTSRSYVNLTSNQNAQNYAALVFGDVASSFVHRSGASSPDESNVIPGTVTTLTLPNVSMDQSNVNFIAAVTTSAVDGRNKLVGFQGDLSFDERTVTFQSEPVQSAGLTKRNWNVSGNVLPGIGPIRALRISAYSNDFTPLSGSGTLFELRMTKVPDPTQGTPLLWAAPPDEFIFIDADLRTQRPGRAAPGSVTTTGKRK